MAVGSGFIFSGVSEYSTYTQQIHKQHLTPVTTLADSIPALVKMIYDMTVCSKLHVNSVPIVIKNVVTYLGCFSANASRSASGSVAKMTVLPCASAVFIDRS